jgi:hypothetical protein
LGMVEGTVRFAIPKGCALEAATLDGPNIFTDTGLGVCAGLRAAQ